MLKSKKEYIDFLDIIPLQYTGKEIRAGKTAGLKDTEQANALAGFSKIQWQNLAEGLIENDPIG